MTTPPALKSVLGLLASLAAVLRAGDDLTTLFELVPSRLPSQTVEEALLQEEALPRPFSTSVHYLVFYYCVACR